jgi:hypothetical protein
MRHRLPRAAPARDAVLTLENHTAAHLTLVFLLYQKGRDDYTVKSGPQRVRDLMGEEAEALLRHRFEIVTTPLTRLKTATIVAIPEQQQVTADEDRGRLVRRP